MSSSSVTSDSEFTAESSESESTSDHRRSESTSDNQETINDDPIATKQGRQRWGNVICWKFKSDSDTKDGESDASGSKNSENGEFNVNERKSDSVFSAESGDGEVAVIKKKRGVKITDETRKLWKMKIYYVDLRDNVKRQLIQMWRREQTKELVQSGENETSDGESSLEIRSTQKVRKKRSRKHGISSDDDSGGIRPTRRSKVDGEKIASIIEILINSDDVLEWDEGDKVEGGGSADHNTSSSETIEKYYVIEQDIQEQPEHQQHATM
ncbi:BMA-CHD-1 [Dirofilaria immitis]|nr:BMA-CHD-1 [Dirofilaria immitis]